MINFQVIGNALQQARQAVEQFRQRISSSPNPALWAEKFGFGSPQPQPISPIPGPQINTPELSNYAAREAQGQWRAQNSPPTPITNTPINYPAWIANSPTPPPPPTTVNGYTQDEIQRAIEEGFKNWGNPPAATMSAQMAAIPFNDPFYATPDRMFMIPSIPVKESGGGKNLPGPFISGKPVSNANRQFNYFGWNVTAKPEDWTPTSPIDVMNHVASGISGRVPYYQKFRETGNLNDFANVYAPLSENPTTGGPYYAQSLKDIMGVFNSKLPKRVAGR